MSVRNWTPDTGIAPRLIQALRLADEERAARAGELIQASIVTVDEGARQWSAEIRARLDRVDAGTRRPYPALRRVAVSFLRPSKPGPRVRVVAGALFFQKHSADLAIRGLRAVVASASSSGSVYSVDALHGD